MARGAFRIIARHNRRQGRGITDRRGHELEETLLRGTDDPDDFAFDGVEGFVFIDEVVWVIDTREIGIDVARERFRRFGANELFEDGVEMNIVIRIPRNDVWLNFADPEIIAVLVAPIHLAILVVLVIRDDGGEVDRFGALIHEIRVLDVRRQNPRPLKGREFYPVVAIDDENHFVGRGREPAVNHVVKRGELVLIPIKLVHDIRRQLGVGVDGIGGFPRPGILRNPADVVAVLPVLGQEMEIEIRPVEKDRHGIPVYGAFRIVHDPRKVFDVFRGELVLVGDV